MSTKELLQFELKRRIIDSGYATWTTRDGREVPIKDMTTQHIQNALNMLERQEAYEVIIQEALESCPTEIFL